MILNCFLKEDEFEQFDSEWKSRASGFLDYPSNMNRQMSEQFGLPSNNRRHKKEFVLFNTF